ncbi:MAG: hypothetical protein JWP25_9009 [Bradyrhizobium sp.]|nr:hypothetical protein [Bradyrhizobium sp.]
MISYWNGKPVDNLSRDELIEVIKYLSAEVQNMRQPSEIRALCLGKVEMMKRGER